MKELWKRKRTKVAAGCIAAAVIIILVWMGVSSGENRKVKSHLALAERYLSELDYEQALVEYTAALAIDPDNQEILDAMERTYLEMAQLEIDVENYEEAVNILDRGYEQIQRIVLLEKREEAAQLRELKEEEARMEEEERKKEEEARKAEEESRVEEESLAETESESAAEEAEREAEESKTEGESQEKEESAAEGERPVEEESKPEAETKQESKSGTAVDKVEAYKKKAENFVVNLFIERYGEEGKEWADIEGTVVAENTETQCKIIVVVMDGTPLTCFEFTIDKTTDQGIISNYYYTTNYNPGDSSVNPYIPEWWNDGFQAIGRLYNFG